MLYPQSLRIWVTDSKLERSFLSQSLVSPLMPFTKEDWRKGGWREGRRDIWFQSCRSHWHGLLDRTLEPPLPGCGRPPSVQLSPCVSLQGATSPEMLRIPTTTANPTRSCTRCSWLGCWWARSLEATPPSSAPRPRRARATSSTTAV